MIKKLTRFEQHNGGYRLISSNNCSNLYNVINKLDSSLGIYRTGDSKVRIFWGGKNDEASNWEFTAENTVYYEQNIIERDMETEEKEFVKNTHMYDLNSIDTIYEVKVPDPEELKNALIEFKSSEYNNVKCKIPDQKSRNRIISKIQKNIAELEYIYNQIKSSGKIHNIPKKYDYRDKNDITKEYVRDKIVTIKDTYLNQWSDIFGVSYYIMKKTRYNYLSIDDPYSYGINEYKYIEKDLINLENILQCEVCHCAMPEEQFLRIPIRSGSDTVRICDECADIKKGHIVKKDDILKAKDNRAKRTNGQRNLNGNYES